MSTTTIEFQWKVDDVLTDVTSAVLSDPTAAYGVRRTDTNAIVVAAGTALTHDGTGLYSYTFTDPAADLTYQYWIQVVYAGATYKIERYKSGTAVTAAGVYGTIEDIRMEMGRFNESQAADPDNQANAVNIALQEQDAIDFADTYINNELAQSNFATPATVNLGILKRVFAKLGAYQLYQVRGLEDKKNAFQGKYDWAVEQLQELTFNNRCGFTRAAGYADAPAAVGPTVDESGNLVSTCRAPYFNGVQWVW
jgi:hypothetical protein